MTPERIVETKAALKCQTYWPHEPEIAADAANAIAVIEHLEDQVQQLHRLIEQFAKDDADTIVELDRRYQKMREGLLRVVVDLERIAAA